MCHAQITLPSPPPWFDQLTNDTSVSRLSRRLNSLSSGRYGRAAANDSPFLSPSPWNAEQNQPLNTRNCDRGTWARTGGFDDSCGGQAFASNHRHTRKKRCGPWCFSLYGVVIVYSSRPTFARMTWPPPVLQWTQGASR